MIEVGSRSPRDGRNGQRRPTGRRRCVPGGVNDWYGQGSNATNVTWVWTPQPRGTSFVIDPQVIFKLFPIWRFVVTSRRFYRTLSCCCAVLLAAGWTETAAAAGHAHASGAVFEKNSSPDKTNKSHDEKEKLLTHSRTRSHWRWGSNIGTKQHKSLKTTGHSRYRSHLRWGSRAS